MPLSLPFNPSTGKVFYRNSISKLLSTCCSCGICCLRDSDTFTISFSGIRKCSDDSDYSPLNDVFVVSNLVGYDCRWQFSVVDGSDLYDITLWFGRDLSGSADSTLVAIGIPFSLPGSAVFLTVVDGQCNKKGIGVANEHTCPVDPPPRGGYGGSASWYLNSEIPVWQISEDYIESNLVVNDLLTYKCILGHNSSAADEPGVGVNWETYWIEV